MDDRQRERAAGEPDPTHDTWSAWLPRLEPPTAPEEQSAAPQEQESAIPPAPTAPLPLPPTSVTPQRSAAAQPVTPVSPGLPQASLPPPKAARARSSSANPGQPAYAGSYPSLPTLSHAGPPPSYIGWALVCTVLCFMPFGIVALVKSASVNTLWANGRVQEARNASRSAKLWCLLAALVWPGVVILGVGVFMLVGIGGLLH